VIDASFPYDSTFSTNSFGQPSGRCRQARWRWALHGAPANSPLPSLER